MKRAFIIHGWASHPQDGWFPWLKLELEQRGYAVTIPAMPHPLVPTIKDWVAAVTKSVGEPDVETLFIGHSIGCQTVLRYLETVKRPVFGAVFVAGWFELKELGNAVQRAGAKPWVETPIGFVEINKVLPRSVAIFSDEDRYVDIRTNEVLFRKYLVQKLYMTLVNAILVAAKG